MRFGRNRGWQNRHRRDTDERHVVPVGDLIQHETRDDECPCGPDVLFEPGGKVIRHHSLDGRERAERGT